MPEPFDELNRHQQLMYFTYIQTMQDISLFVDPEFRKVFEHSFKITKEKYSNAAKAEPNLTEDDFFEKVLDLYIKAHEDEHFSFGLVKGVNELENLMLPLHDDNTYKNKLCDILNFQEGSAIDFDEKISYIAVGIRFYHELGKSRTFSFESDLPIMLKIDRVLSYVRIDLAIAKNTSPRRQSEALRTAGRQAEEYIKNASNPTGYEEAIRKVLKGKKPCGSFEQFKDFIRNEMPINGRPSIKTIERHLKKEYGQTSKTFDKTLTFFRKILP